VRRDDEVEPPERARGRQRPLEIGDDDPWRGDAIDGDELGRVEARPQRRARGARAGAEIERPRGRRRARGVELAQDLPERRDGARRDLVGVLPPQRRIVEVARPDERPLADEPAVDPRGAARQR
jgi:hypothetical protein